MSCGQFMSDTPNRPRWYPPEGTSVAPQKPEPRSRVSKRKKAFVVGDGRSGWARRWKDLLDDLHGRLGGAEKLSETQLGLCRRIATIQIECERLEGQLSLGQKVDLDLYSRLSANMKRLNDTVGLKSGAVEDDGEPASLDTYLAKRGGKT